jgi:hypothetical protein
MQKQWSSTCELASACNAFAESVMLLRMIDYAFQESTSLEDLCVELSLRGGPSHMALEKMLTYTQSLRCLSLVFPGGQLKDTLLVTAVRSGLKMNITIQELTQEFSQGATTVSPTFTGMRHQPLLRRLCLHFLWVCGGSEWIRECVAE